VAAAGLTNVSLFKTTPAIILKTLGSLLEGFKWCLKYTIEDLFLVQWGVPLNLIWTILLEFIENMGNIL